MKKKLLCITPINHISGLKKKLSKYFTIKYIPQITKKEIIEISDKYEVIFTNPNKTRFYLNEKILKNKKKLKVICTASTGTNHIDLNYAKKNKIKVISLRKDIKILKKITSTAEHATALMFSSIRNISESNIDVKKNNWDYSNFIGRQLKDLTIGIIGYGRLGKIYTNIVTSLTKKILIYEKNFKINDKNKKYQVNLDALLRNSDIISLHIHADQENINFINKKKLSKVKKNLLLINTSRGEIINENNLLNFLKINKKSKYATDVLNKEILGIKNNKILKFSKKTNRILITPHIGGMTEEAQEIAYHYSADKIIHLFNK